MVKKSDVVLATGRRKCAVARVRMTPGTGKIVVNGRDVDIQGAHCADNGGNINSIGICYIGGCARDGKTPKDTRTDAQKLALLNLLLDLKKLYPHAVILGHRDLDEHGKLCPSFDAKKEYRLL